MRSIKFILITVLSVFMFLSCNLKNSDKTQDSNVVIASTDDADVDSSDGRDYIVKVGDLAPDFEMKLPKGVIKAKKKRKNRVVDCL